MRSLVETYFKAVGVQPNIIMELENIEAIKSLVRAGLGAAVLPYCSVAGSTAGSGLKALRIERVPMSRELCLLLPNSEIIPMAISKLASRILKVLPASWFASAVET
jgi:LysR family transcriptional activator of glutamate synthase operon